MVYQTDYFWVVACKNRRFHHQQSIFYNHNIALGETDAYSPPPHVDGKFTVRCNSCGEEYSYTPMEVLRAEIEPPARFVPHPLFQ